MILDVGKESSKLKRPRAVAGAGVPKVKHVAKFDNITQLIDKCKSGVPQEQVMAIHRLGDHHAYSAAPTLVKLLQSPDAVVRSTAAQYLGLLGSKDPEHVGPALLRALDDGEAIVRAEIVDALASLGYLPGLEKIKALLIQDPDALVRACAAEALGDLGNQEVLPELELSLTDDDESVRAYAANAIGLLGSVRLLPKLQQYAEQASSLRVKAEMLGAKYRLGESGEIKRILGLLQNSDEDLSTNILNMLDDFTEREIPSSLVADAPDIIEALTGLAKRLPRLKPDVTSLSERLLLLTSVANRSGKKHNQDSHAKKRLSD